MAADLVELRMNVAALKRVDPYIKDILGTATQVALYTFSALKNEWEKTDVEGALFVCSRNGEPYNSILIMNRLNTNNLVEPIVKDLDWQMQAPFLLYRNQKNNIFGIWFYNRDDCIKTTYLLENIMESISQQEKVRLRRPTTGSDIFTMLTKAQEDYNAKTPVKSEPPQAQSTPRAPDVTTPQSVMDFFAKASTTKTSLHSLMSNTVHSVEHIEKQQRAVTPQSSFINLQQQSVPVPPPPPPPPQQQDVLSDTRPPSPPLAALLEATPQKPALIPPIMFATTTKEKSERNPEQLEPLTQKQMVQAFHYLLKNDPDFVTKLHEAYVKSFSEMVS